MVVQVHKLYLFYNCNPLVYRGLGFDAEVLLFLYREKRVVRRAFKDAGFSYVGAQNALERFESVGLTQYEAVGDYRDTVYWSLTPKGERAAEMLAELDDFIRNGV